ncbi:MAG: two-component regulator propeller domain-containing protein [Bacteroidota bacterium]
MLNIAPDYRKRCHKIGLLLFLIFAFIWEAKAQEGINFRSFGKKEGLSQSTVFSIAQDSIGYMWFGTRNGLNRFDGLEMKVYRHEAGDSLSIPNNEIRTLYFDKIYNTLLIGTTKGLAKFDHLLNAFIPYRLLGKESLAEDITIRAISRDLDKNLWIASSEGLFFQRFGQKTFQNIKFDSLPIDPWCLFIKQKAQVWVGSSMGILSVRLTADGKINIEEVESLARVSTFIISAIKSDQAANIWIGTEGKGLYRWNPHLEALKKFPIAKYDPFSISNEAVRTINVSKDARIWVGTRHGLNIIDPDTEEVRQSFYTKSNSESISDNSIRSIYFDTNGAAWVGTYFGGINYSNSNLSRFKYFEPELSKNSLNYPIVSSFCELEKGKFLIGTEGGGINTFNRNSLAFGNSINEAIPELAEQNIKCIIHAGDSIWIGTYTYGLIMYNLRNGSYKVFQHDPEDEGSIPSNNVYGLIVRGKKLWIATFGGGLARMDMQTGKFSSWKHLRQDSLSLKDNRLRSLIFDSAEKLWIGTDNGLNMASLEDIEANQFKRLLNGKRVNVLQRSKSGNIWVGSYQYGLFLLDTNGKVLKNYGIKEGLPGLSIFGIVEDGHNAVWFSTNNGIAKLDLRDESITAYNNSDGLKTLEFNFNAYHKSEDGEIYFGSTRGFTVFRPGEIKINTFVPPLAFNFLKLGAEEVRVNGPDQLLKKSINYTKEINLPYDQSNFTLSFAALDFQNPTHNYLSYKLEGIDKEWSVKKGISSVSYTIQREGSYLFNFKVANSDGIWNPSIKKLKIRVLPPFWRTNWAYSLYVALLCLVGFILYRVVKLQRKLRYEEIEKKHQKDLNESKLRFFTDITHEFRTPLTLILGPVEDLINGREERYPEKLKSIYQNTKRLLTLINQLMDFRRLDSQQRSLKMEKIELNSFLQEMWASFKEMADEKELDFQLNKAELPVFLQADREKLEKVFFNLLSNAFKFTPSKGLIIIESESREMEVSIKVKNSGKQIKAEYKERIFDRFFEKNDKSTSSVKGSGIGLSLSKKLIELHGGRLYLDPLPNWKGACFRVDLPINIGDQHPQDLKAELEHREFDQLSGKYQVFEHPSGKKARILLVEDNPEILNYVEDLMTEFYEVFIANDGQEGLEMAKEIMPDLLISDIMMPKKSGTDLCRELKADFSTSHIPVILLTAKSTKDAEILGLETGADKYIRKPFHPYELHLHIKNLLELKYRIRNNFGKLLKLEPDKLVFSSEDDLFLQNAIKLIEEHIDKSEFRIEDFAREMGVSRALLFIKLRALSDMTPNNFVKKLRLKRAAQILEDSRKTVAEVSYMVGFQDPKYFSRCFKASYGESPNEFRKRIRANEE